MLYTESLHSIQAITHNDLERDLYAGRAYESSYVVAYVTQMFAIPTNEFPQFQVPSNDDHHSSISTSFNPSINQSSIHKKNNSNQNASQYLNILSRQSSNSNLDYQDSKFKDDEDDIFSEKLQCSI
ncbi:hypothetical protein O181_113341 [Austropuccinia psidii MF-1]|uniref:Uncharacterized protein n=1 Tax=Austropuccinia psidii MF-1 TaxID=1389203 RepID=A0A9Q3K4R1_9BASI|nr:hypothetical protein [Austropuccinia psidii MF-1]